MKLLLTMAATAFLAATSAVSAATYHVDGLLNNYGASLIHDMYGSTLIYFDEEVESGGEWDSDSGDIHFAGTLGGGSYDYYAEGNIDTNGGGYLDFLFSDSYGSFGYTFNFDGDMPMMGPYNSFVDGVISLWGDTMYCDYGYYYDCLGMDLRIAVSEKPSEVPLPASALLLLGGMGAFAGLRRKKS